MSDQTPPAWRDWNAAIQKARRAYNAEPIATLRLCIECLRKPGTSKRCLHCRETLRLREFRKASR